MVNEVSDEVVGYRPIEFLLKDPEVTEVVMNRPDDAQLILVKRTTRLIMAAGAAARGAARLSLAPPLHHPGRSRAHSVVLLADAQPRFPLLAKQIRRPHHMPRLEDASIAELVEIERPTRRRLLAPQGPVSKPTISAPCKTVQDAMVSDGAPMTAEELYQNEHQRLWRSVLLFSGDPEIASDAVAEAFAQLLRRGDQVRSPKPWVWRATFRIAGGELKRRSVNTELPDDIAQTAQPEDISLAIALHSLSPHQRSSIVLHYFAGYTYKEVAEIIGSTAAAVSVHITRGRRRLRRVLEEDHGQD
jgi:RNA polymerase sigma-70 factor (ECF subfamily)